MKLGLYSSIASPPRGENLDRCVDEVIAEAKLAEDAGFDSCFFGEHHQDKDGFLPSPLIIATAVAANTWGSLPCGFRCIGLLAQWARLS